MKPRTKITIIFSAVITLAACASKNTSSANQKEQNTNDAAKTALLISQPGHTYQRSQIRQNQLDIEDAQASTVLTTTFFFNQGVADPHDVCPSIGFPIAASNQISNPLQVVGNTDRALATIGNIEPTGIYTGNSTGTYVICIDANGKGYANYEEGFVKTVTHPATWDYTKHQVVLTGDATGTFHTTTP